MKQQLSDTGDRVISVSELNRSARDLLEHGVPLAWIGGEISNLTLASSRHCYFSLKDDVAQVRCVMFRHRYQYLDWAPKNGEQVEVRALATIYEARGDFQLNIDTMRVAGLGALYEAFQKLRLKLETEGLFEPSSKKALPSFPKTIGIITFPPAAPWRDVLTTLRRRMPSIKIIIYPTQVQGEGAREKITNAINAASRRAECDALILCRGGGSIEDLWAFNEEAVARAIYASTIPLVTGVGHETDFTIVDFVADARAPTPTAAAEILSPDRTELRAGISRLGLDLKRNLGRMLERRMQHIDYLSKRLLYPGERIQNQRTHLAYLYARMHQAWQRSMEAQRRAAREHAQQLFKSTSVYLERFDARLLSLQMQLTALNPQSVLERGYSIARMADGSLVRDVQQVAVGQSLRVSFAEGEAEATVTKTTME